MGSGLESLRYSRSDPAVASARGQTVKILAIQDLTPVRLHRSRGMIGGGPFRLAAGQCTDDTSMALCLADSLVISGFDLRSA